MNRLQTFLKNLKSSNGHLDRASELEHLNAQIEANPNSANAYFQRGVFFGRGNIESIERYGHYTEEHSSQALCDYRKAIELDSHFIKAYFHQASLLFALDMDDSTAEDIIEQALSIAPSNVECLLLYADIVCCDGVNPHAIEILDRVIATAPCAKHFFYKARALMDCGEMDWFLDNIVQGTTYLKAAISIFEQVLLMDDNGECLDETIEYIEQCYYLLDSHIYH